MNRIKIHATKLYSNGKIYDNQYIIIENDKIVSVKKYNNQKVDYIGIVTPAFIDGHNHIGMYSRLGDGANEDADSISPNLDPINNIVHTDYSFSNAIDFGILYSCLVPGSGNLFGGKAILLKNWGRNRKEMKFKELGYKMALGDNLEFGYLSGGERFSTRMGWAQFFDDVCDFLEKKIIIQNSEEELSVVNSIRKNEKTLNELSSIYQRMNLANWHSTDLSLLEILEGKALVKCHVHREDDIWWLLEKRERYPINLCLEHVLDLQDPELIDELVKQKIPIIWGPITSVRTKNELHGMHYKNVSKLLENKDLLIGLMTDHDVLDVTSLLDQTKYFIAQGMSEEQALSLITINNAKIHKIDDILGSVEPNKLASLLIWNQSPFHIGSLPKIVIGEGKILKNEK